MSWRIKGSASALMLAALLFLGACLVVLTLLERGAPSHPSYAGVKKEGFFFLFSHSSSFFH